MTGTKMHSGLNLFPPHKPAPQLNPLVLAYIGDAVYEVMVRQYVVSRGNFRPHQLHRKATAYVSAKGQARALQDWLPQLTEEEMDIFKRGRNAKSGTMPKNANVLEYRHSTGFECLIGYLYYTQRFDRLRQLVLAALACIDGENEEGKS